MWRVFTPSGFFIETLQTGKMLFGAGVVAVVWNDSTDVQTECTIKARSNRGRVIIEECGRQVSEPVKAREEVRREQEPEALAEVAGVTTGMSRQVDCL